MSLHVLTFPYTFTLIEKVYCFRDKNVLGKLDTQASKPANMIDSQDKLTCINSIMNFTENSTAYRKIGIKYTVRKCNNLSQTRISTPTLHDEMKNNNTNNSMKIKVIFNIHTFIMIMFSLLQSKLNAMIGK